MPLTDDSVDSECFTYVLTCNSFAGFPEIFDHSYEAHVPDLLSTERVEGSIQQRFKLMCRNRKEAITLNQANSHPNHHTLALNLAAKGIPHKHLKRYMLAVSCDAW